jgi:cytochrome c-type biogenesis protein CcmH
LALGIGGGILMGSRKRKKIADLSDDEEAEVARIFTSSSEGDHR